MPGSIQPDGAPIYHSYRSANDRLTRVLSQMATGNRLLPPGEDVAAFEEVSKLDLDRSRDGALALSVQSRMSWFHTSVAHLQEVAKMLSSMSEVAVQAQSPALKVEDRIALDATFQEYKQAIAAIVDGRGGQDFPVATFNGQPLFLGYGPESELGGDATLALERFKGINLFTGLGHEGFLAIPLISGAATSAAATLTGTAQAGSTTQVTLDVNAAGLDDVYQGMTIRITAGAGAGQTAEVAAYDAKSGVATFKVALAVPLDATSQYEITDSISNIQLRELPALTALQFASHVWGADNDRGSLQGNSLKTFRSLTEAERDYRLANAVPDTDLVPKTYEEKIRRRELNIFDPEFGSLVTQRNASTMSQQLQRAMDQIAHLISLEGAKDERLSGQYRLYQKRMQAQTEGIEVQGGVNPAEAAMEVESLTQAQSRALSIATRLSQNIGRLNDLVRSGGVRGR